MVAPQCRSRATLRTQNSFSFQNHKLDLLTWPTTNAYLIPGIPHLIQMTVSKNTATVTVVSLWLCPLRRLSWACKPWALLPIIILWVLPDESIRMKPWFLVAMPFVPSSFLLLVMASTLVAMASNLHAKTVAVLSDFRDFTMYFTTSFWNGQQHTAFSLTAHHWRCPRNTRHCLLCSTPTPNNRLAWFAL